MNKAYNRINWENSPSEKTPLNEQNLNRMDAAVDEIDNRVLAIDTTKFNKVDAQTLVKSITLDQDGVLTITYFNNTTATIDTKLEKMAVNFAYDYQAQQLVITLDDGTKQYVDLSALITEYEFADSDTIAFTLSADGKVSAVVKEGSIQEKHLRPDYLADIKGEEAKAQASATAAAGSASSAEASRKLAESYARGGTGIREGEDTDNAKAYSEQAKEAASKVSIMTEESVGIGKPDGTTMTVDPDGTMHVIGNEGTIDYNELENKPSISGVTLQGNKTLGDLGGAEVKELTVAEFEALPEGKDEEEAIYFIKDAAPTDSPLITEERIETIESGLTDLGTEVAGNTQDISSLNSTVAQHETDISALETTTAQHGTDITALESGKADVDGIVLTGDVTGTSSFNAETGKTEISAQRRGCYIYRSRLAGTELGWYKIASKEYDVTYMDFSISFLVSCTYMGHTNTGILRVMVRTQPSGGFQKYKIEIPYSAGLTPSDFILGLYTNKNGRPVAEIYCKNVMQYLCITFDVLAEAVTSRPDDTWTLYSYNGEPGITEIPSSYTQIPATLAMIQNPVSNQLSVYSGATGGGYGKSFRFSLTHSSGDASRTPILIILGSQTDNQTSMLPITLYSNGTIGKPANLSSEFGTITAEDGLVTINTTFNNRWAMFMIFYDATLVTILPA